MEKSKVFKVTLALFMLLGWHSDSIAERHDGPEPSVLDAGPNAKTTDGGHPIQVDGSGSDKGAKTTRAIPVPQPTLVYGPSIGGGGGGRTNQVCRHAYGIQTDVTVVGVIRFGLRCTDDTETAFWDLPVVGAPGRALSSLECQPGFEITGFQGRSGSFIDAIGLICRPTDLTKRVFQDKTLVYGGPGGGDFVWECPRSFHISNVAVMSGTSIDNLQVVCEHD